MKSLLSALLRICPTPVRNAVRGKLAWQPFFERLHDLALVGMNYEEGFLIEISGELDLLARIQVSHTEGNPCVILDAGANVGKYTQAVLGIFLDDQCLVHAFEPSSVAAEEFASNIGPEDRVCLHRLALADTVGVSKLYSDSEGSPVSTLTPDSPGGIYGRDQMFEDVRTETLDRFCHDNRIERIHLLKMDVEGCELKILKGASEMLAAERIDGIQWEFGYNNVYSRVFFRDFYDMLSPQYNLFRLVKDGIYPLSSAYPYEVFRTANYYARLKRLPPLPLGPIRQS